MGPIRLRATDKLAAQYKRYANKLGAELFRQGSATGVRHGMFEGYVFKARKQGGRVTVDAVEVPGRFEGSNQYRGALDALQGESSIDGVVVSSSPGFSAMAPDSNSITEVAQEARQGSLGFIHAFGDPLPESPVLLYNSFASEFEGGVVFVHIYAGSAPPGNASTGFTVTDQPLWLVLLVRWAGAGAPRSVSFSDDYIGALGGGSFYPRHVVRSGAAVSPIRYGARLPVAHYHAGRLVAAIELEESGGGNSTIGRLLTLEVEYADGAAQLAWSHVVTAESLGSTLAPDVFADAEAGNYRAHGFDLPAVFAWTDASGASPVKRAVASWRVRSRKRAGSSYRLVTAQVLASITGAVQTLDVSYVDSVAGLDAGLPQIESARVFIQKYRDTFFLGANGGLVRHRRMRLSVRPSADADISAAAPTTLAIHADLAYLRTEYGGSSVGQLQSSLGYGPEEVPAGALASNGVNAIENVGFETPVAPGEVWGWGFINNSGAQQIGIARITTGGVAAPLAAGIPRSLRLSTYQQEVRNEDGLVVVPMAQVATITDDGAPKIAIKKGRFGAMDFVPAASYSRFGTFYTSSPVRRPRYGRLFG